MQQSHNCDPISYKFVIKVIQFSISIQFYPGLQKSLTSCIVQSCVCVHPECHESSLKSSHPPLRTYSDMKLCIYLIMA